MHQDLLNIDITVVWPLAESTLLWFKSFGRMAIGVDAVASSAAGDIPFLHHDSSILCMPICEHHFTLRNYFVGATRATLISFSRMRALFLETGPSELTLSHGVSKSPSSELSNAKHR